MLELYSARFGASKGNRERDDPRRSIQGRQRICCQIAVSPLGCLQPTD